MGLITKYIAQFWDEKGNYIGSTSFNRLKKTLKYKNKIYHIKIKEGSYYKRKNLSLGLVDKTYYQYNISCSDPLIMDKKVEPKINPEDYNTMLETSVIRKLNNINNNIFDKIDFKKVLIGLGVLVVGYLVITGGITP